MSNKPNGVNEALEGQQKVLIFMILSVIVSWLTLKSFDSLQRVETSEQEMLEQVQ